MNMFVFFFLFSWSFFGAALIAALQREFTQLWNKSNKKQKTFLVLSAGPFVWLAFVARIIVVFGKKAFDKIYKLLD